MGGASLVFDPNLCVGCNSCEVACKQKNGLPVGVHWIQVITIGPYKAGERLRMRFSSVRCMHCAKAPCIDTCPENAIVKRADGIVLIDEEACIGCKKCIEVCPFGAIQFNDERGVVWKCTLCAKLIDEGLEPSCAKHCMTGALRFGDVNEVIELMRQSRAAAQFSGESYLGG